MTDGSQSTAGGSRQPRAPRMRARSASVAGASTCPSRDHHAVIAPRRLEADEFVADVAQDGRRVAFQRIAPAAGAGHFVAEHVAALHGHGELGGEQPVLRCGLR